MQLTVESSCDANTWDAFVSGQPSGHFMQSHAWGQFRRAHGWEPHYCQVRDAGRLRAAALVLARRLPGLGRSLLCAPRGPVVEAGDRSAASALLEGLGELVDRTGVGFVRFDPYWRESDASVEREPVLGLPRLPRDWSYWNAPRFVFWLDLQGDEARLMARMSSTCRNEVRRGYRSGITFEHGSVDDVAEFHRLMVSTGGQKGIAFHEMGYYRHLLDVLPRSLDIQLFFGRFEGQVVTTGISARYGARAWLLYAASAPEHYKLRANRTQQWEMIRWAHALGCTRYDFRGTATNDPPDPKDSGYGVYTFKKSFGPEFTRLVGYYDLVRSPLAHRFARLVEERALPAAYRMRTWLTAR
jgi:lipid II:glycine glycyltransferase (peptidoglycan interpeptide bridge formation enzyme)